MEKFVINGGTELHGTVNISGAKNAAVAIIPAAILCNGICTIENIPTSISDVTMMLRILESVGAKLRLIDKNTIEIDSTAVNSDFVCYEYTKHLRASYYLLGALLGRFSSARVAMPGGCDLGVRPIDQHIKGFEALGATVKIEENAIVNAKAEELTGGHVYLDVVSVGATINIMLAAVCANGKTIIENAAREPHIVDLANFLNTMGADIRGAGTDVIKIRGVEELHGCQYSIIPDQIEAGTYMLAAAATNGDVIINNVIPKHLESISTKLLECGVTVEEYDECIRVCGNGRVSRCNIKTMPHPGFPTDMQPQMAVLLSVAKGTSIISEGIWENRYRYVDQLMRMGASIKVDGKLAVIEGVDHLNGAPVRADDLRAGAAMIIAGLMANGTTEIEDILHIDRGYEYVVEKLTGLGADIKRIETPDPVRISNAG
ncbi:MAG: UDP-N-acetylglucosamine 1-carboxyvinyltransferase [Clostridia bacterium]|jgi:UDP-N-acetylglucosamine 1-carboxyvinyltransferase|nr:UDP-N-acetylglucosamine 1-carboxyvinyltransferase [Clostridia bacterium]MBQ4244828.1 UDP-N-acetylglucosamine 1-carboxyvinyltransferase [Clostridia bacterium]